MADSTSGTFSPSGSAGDSLGNYGATGPTTTPVPPTSKDMTTADLAVAGRKNPEQAQISKRKPRNINVAKARAAMRAPKASKFRGGYL